MAGRCGYANVNVARVPASLFARASCNVPKAPRRARCLQDSATPQRRTSIVTAESEAVVTFGELDGSTRTLTLESGEYFTHLTEDGFVGRDVTANKPIALVTAMQAFAPWDYPFNAGPHWIESDEPFRATLCGQTSVSTRIEFLTDGTTTEHHSAAFAVPLLGYDPPPPSIE